MSYFTAAPGEHPSDEPWPDSDGKLLKNRFWRNQHVTRACGHVEVLDGKSSALRAARQAGCTRCRGIKKQIA